MHYEWLKPPAEEVISPPLVLDLYESLGRPAPPPAIYQPAVDDPAVLAKLLQFRDVTSRVDEGPVYEYCLSLKYADDPQPDLLLFALPLCLQRWQHCLFSEEYSEERGSVAAMFHEALMRRPGVIQDSVGVSAATHVARFMRDTILARMSYESSIQKQAGDTSAHTWIGFLASYGCIWADMGKIFETCKRVEYKGIGIATLIYLSMLTYDDRENVVFPAWTPSAGSDAPRPWDYATETTGFRWLPENVDWAARWFSVSTVDAWVQAAAQRLSDHPEAHVARSIAEDVMLQPYRIEARIRDLIQHMASTEPYKYWSDDYGIAQ